MSSTKARTSRATDLLRADHEEARRLFLDYAALDDDGSRRSLLARISENLVAHAELEEEGFYPAIVDLGEEGRDHVHHGSRAHVAIRALLSKLARMNPKDPLFDHWLQELRQKVEQHAEQEERTGFPLFARLDRDARDRVSLAVWSLKLGEPCDEEEVREDPPAAAPPDPGR